MCVWLGEGKKVWVVMMQEMSISDDLEDVKDNGKVLLS